MHSLIRIGLFALCIQFLIAPNLTFAQTRPEALPSLDSLSFDELKRIAGNLFSTAEKIETSLASMEEKASEKMQFSEIQLTLAKQDSSLSKTTLDSLSKAFKSTKSELKSITSQHKRATNLVLRTSLMPEMDSLNLCKNLPNAGKDITRLYEELYPATISEKPEIEVVAVKKPKEKKKSKKSKESELASDGEARSDNPDTTLPTNPPKRFAKYNPDSDVMLNPPVPPCIISASSRDEFSGEVSREMAQAELFRYTNPALKTYLQGKTHVICEAALASTGTKTTLLLTFTINDPNARKAFGRLEKNSIATIKFLDGSTFELQNAISDDGVFSPENDASIFRAQYPLNSEVLKKIRRNGLDKLRVLWSKGYDDYDVQQVDLLMRQAECLFK